MPTVAEQLSAGRAARHLTIEQVADITKIRGDHLRALEEGNFDVFSAPVYIRGFVRSYSTVLKLDVPQVMAELDSELSQSEKFAEPPPLSESPKGVLDFVMLQLSKLDWRKGAVAVAVLLVGGISTVSFLIWRHARTADPLKGLKPGVYHSSKPDPAQTLPLPKH
jgi:cytoskeletal protein RodZ